MLVLTRKLGQQIILPKQGIVIEVMRVGRSQVRLGIDAPAEVSIHRRNGSDLTDEKAGGPLRRMARDQPALKQAAKGHSGELQAAARSLADFDRRLVEWIMQRTGGRISELAVETRDGQFVVRGSARSYYARQLAEAAVREILENCDNPVRCLVQVKIEIGQVYWRSNGPTRGLARLGGDRIEFSESP
jgi:carbon storage regulator CsrA